MLFDSARVMTNIRRYKDLQVWQAGMDLVDVCFDVVEAIPSRYRYVFCNQLLRAGVSIPANIAEGSRRTRKGYIAHLSYSLGSQAEVETILVVLGRRKLIPASLLAKANSLCDSIGRMLHGLSRALKRTSTQPAQ